MRHEQEDFRLEAPRAGLMTLAVAAQSFNITRQCFHRWDVRPVRVQGTRRLYDLASVIQNRLEHAAEADQTPEDLDQGRLQARIDLLIEQIEGQRIQNDRARTQYARRDHAEAALSASMDAAASIIEKIAPAIFEAIPKAEPARQVVEASVDDAASALRGAVLKLSDSDTGTAESYA